MRTVEDWRTLLRSELKRALVERRVHAAAVLRETLAAIDNAEAPPVRSVPAGEASPVFARAVRGVGAGEIARIQLSPAAMTAIIQREIEDRRRAAAEYSTLGRHEEACALAAQVEVLVSLASDQT